MVSNTTDSQRHARFGLVLQYDPPPCRSRFGTWFAKSARITGWTDYFSRVRGAYFLLQHISCISDTDRTSLVKFTDLGTSCYIPSPGRGSSLISGVQPYLPRKLLQDGMMPMFWELLTRIPQRQATSIAFDFYFHLSTKSDRLLYEPSYSVLSLLPKAKGNIISCSI